MVNVEKAHTNSMVCWIPQPNARPSQTGQWVFASKHRKKSEQPITKIDMNGCLKQRQKNRLISLHRPLLCVFAVGSFHSDKSNSVPSTIPFYNLHSGFSSGERRANKIEWKKKKKKEFDKQQQYDSEIAGSNKKATKAKGE